MRENIAKRLMKNARDIDLMYNPKCTDPDCNHRDCIKDNETGGWYKKVKVPYQLEGDEVIGSLLSEQIVLLRSIRSMLLFFMVIAIVGFVVAIVTGVNAGVLLFQ